MRRRIFTAFAMGAAASVLALGAAASGCAFDWTFSAPADDGDSATADALVESAALDAGLEDDVIGSEASPPPLSGCHSTMQCAKGTYCHFADDTCGNGGTDGQCSAYANLCAAVSPTPQPPACGCDAVVYTNACNAAQAGFDVSATAACITPAGTFRCGSVFCDSAKSFCKITPSAAPVDRYACVSLLGCAPATCQCTAIKSLTKCACDASKVDGGLAVLCP